MWLTYGAYQVKKVKNGWWWWVVWTIISSGLGIDWIWDLVLGIWLYNLQCSLFQLTFINSSQTVFCNKCWFRGGAGEAERYFCEECTGAMFKCPNSSPCPLPLSSHCCGCETFLDKLSSTPLIGSLGLQKGRARKWQISSRESRVKRRDVFFCPIRLL